MRIIGLILLLATGAVAAPTFTLDPASPSLVGGITPADTLLTGPVLSAQIPGLLRDFPGGAYDFVDAISSGSDPLEGPIYFTVDRTTVGLPGSAVFAESRPGVASAADRDGKGRPPRFLSALTH